MQSREAALPSPAGTLCFQTFCVESCVVLSLKVCESINQIKSTQGYTTSLPFGEYNERKRKKNQAVRLITVQVFPLLPYKLGKSELLPQQTNLENVQSIVPACSLLNASLLLHCTSVSSYIFFLSSDEQSRLRRLKFHPIMHESIFPLIESACVAWKLSLPVKSIIH